jgi:hypothetical protein
MIRIITSLILIAAGVAAAAAQTYPSRVIKIIVPNIAGAPGDVVARLSTSFAHLVGAAEQRKREGDRVEANRHKTSYHSANSVAGMAGVQVVVTS